MAAATVRYSPMVETGVVVDVPALQNHDSIFGIERFHTDGAGGSAAWFNDETWGACIGKTVSTFRLN